MHKLRLLALLAILASCESSTQKTTTTTSANKKTTTRTTTSTNQQTGSIQHIVQRTHPFSSATQPDYFRLALRGDDIATGEVEFTITTQSGRKIYEEHFPAADLEASLVYEMTTPTATKAQREAYILKRMDEFVQPADFVTPAIPSGATVETTFVKEDIWKRIQADPKAIGFKYLLGKEDGRLLVYDPEQKKAVRYGSFGG